MGGGDGQQNVEGPKTLSKFKMTGGAPLLRLYPCISLSPLLSIRTPPQYTSVPISNDYDELRGLVAVLVLRWSRDPRDATCKDVASDDHAITPVNYCHHGVRRRRPATLLAGSYVQKGRDETSR